MDYLNFGVVSCKYITQYYMEKINIEGGWLAK